MPTTTDRPATTKNAIRFEENPPRFDRPFRATSRSMPRSCAQRKANLSSSKPANGPCNAARARVDWRKVLVTVRRPKVARFPSWPRL